MVRKRMFASIAVLAMVLGALSVVGCSSQPQTQVNPIVGTWAPVSGTAIKWEFAEDGKLIQSTASGTNTSTASWQNVTSTYSISGNVLTINSPETSTTPSQPTTMTLEWVNTDQFQISMGGMNVTFSRAK